MKYDKGRCCVDCFGVRSVDESRRVVERTVDGRQE